MLTKRTERCAVARRGEADGGHAAQHLSNIEMASRRLCPPYGSQACSAHSRERRNPGQRALEFAAPGSPLSRGRAERVSARRHFAGLSLTIMARELPQFGTGSV